VTGSCSRTASGFISGQPGPWSTVDTVYLENWHIDLIAENVEAVTAGLD
jgi:hypothetical protein